ncbi:phytanoyl-CoA dioxygenase family protein [Paenibacillus gansuensis]|uniref:Phytanoyl-CoA dioxygenase family protein n=1 Tax=Paenibacillus gansuensis TaxID=306542 RepID=A0ABW5PHB6_9BACL
MSQDQATSFGPVLEGDYVLTAEQVASYQKNGHILLRQAANEEEISLFQPAIEETVREAAMGLKPLEERDTYGKAFIQICNLWKMNPVVARFVLARRFAKIAAELMGVDGVRIYHDQALFKEPGGGHTPWHQDQIYWPLDTDKTITMWMPLVPVPEEIGSMTFVDESHLNGFISRELISDESHRTLKEYIEKKGLQQVQYGALAAGDATFHAGWTLHSAPGNPTPNTRQVMTVIYYADGTKALEPDSNARRNDLSAWLPGVQPGEPAATELNPLLYKHG